jgi:hypothetical protein
LASDIGAFELAPKLTLARSAQGPIRLDYSFAAGRTNRVMASTNLLEWVSLGTRITDTNGTFQFEDTESPSLPLMFYKVEDQASR